LKLLRKPAALLLISLVLFSTFTFLQFTFVSTVFATTSSFGYTGVGGSTVSIEGYIVGSVFTCVDGGTALNITAYLNPSTNYVSAVKAGVYKHSDLSLVGNTTAANIPALSESDWFTFTFAVQPTLLAGTDYVLVIWGTSGTGTCTVSYTNNDTANQGHTQTKAYGVWPEPYAPSHLSSKLSIYCNYTVAPTPPAVISVGGSVAESFSVLGARATALSSSLSATASFVVSGLDGMVFQRFGVAPLSFALNGLKAVSATTAGSIVESFTVASGRIDSLLRFGSASLSTALSGARSLLESVGGIVTEAFDVGTLRSWTVLKQALVPLTTTLSSVASGLYGAIITLYSSIPLTFTSVSSRVLSIIRQGNVAEALAVNTVHTLAFLKGGLASLGASVSNVLSFTQSVGGSVLEAFTVSSSRLVALLELGSVSESFTVGASRYLAVLRYGLASLTASLSSLAESLLRSLNLYGLVPESFVTEAGKMMEMFTLGSVTQALGALGLKAMTLLKTSEATVAFAITKLIGGLPTLLTFFGSIIESFNIASLGSSFMLPYAHVGGDYFIVGVAAGLLCAMIAMASIGQRLRRTRRRL